MRCKLLMPVLQLPALQTSYQPGWYFASCSVPIIAGFLVVQSRIHPVVCQQQLLTVLQLALCREQLQKANDEIEELYAKNEELEAALEQLATKLAEADDQQKLARSKEEKLIEEKEALVSKHVAANAEKNQRIEELSSEVSASTCLLNT